MTVVLVRLKIRGSPSEVFYKIGILRNYPKITKNIGASVCVCVCVRFKSFTIPLEKGLDAGFKLQKLTKLILQIGHPSLRQSSWWKSALILKPLAQIPEVCHQHGIAEKIKNCLGINVATKIKNLDTKKAAPQDDIPVKILKLNNYTFSQYRLRFLMKVLKRPISQTN